MVKIHYNELLFCTDKHAHPRFLQAFQIKDVKLASLFDDISTIALSTVYVHALRLHAKMREVTAQFGG